MIRQLFNKALRVMENKTQPIDPHARLAALVEHHHEAFLKADRDYTAGLIDASALDRAKTNLADAEKALAAFDAEREQAAAIADRRAQRGTSLQQEALALDAEIEATVATLEQLFAKAQPIADEIERDFRVVGGLTVPFVGSPIVERLMFWTRGVSAFNGAHVWCEMGRFADRLAEYRRLLAPPTPEPAVYRPTPETAAQKAARQRQAMENSRKRSVGVAGGGVVIEAA